VLYGTLQVGKEFYACVKGPSGTSLDFVEKSIEMLKGWPGEKFEAVAAAGGPQVAFDQFDEVCLVWPRIEIVPG
jgi:hypothetical protein